LPGEPGTLVFVPSYFDFVRLRNYLKRQMQSFVQLHEYAEAGRVAKARQLFVLGDRRLMLLTERFFNHGKIF
jgi:U3 small nucleolar RNA-associated protein 25